MQFHSRRLETLPQLRRSQDLRMHTTGENPALDVVEMIQRESDLDAAIHPIHNTLRRVPRALAQVRRDFRIDQHPNLLLGFPHEASEASPKVRVTIEIGRPLETPAHGLRLLDPRQDEVSNPSSARIVRDHNPAVFQYRQMERMNYSRFGRQSSLRLLIDNTYLTSVADRMQEKPKIAVFRFRHRIIRGEQQRTQVVNW